LLAMPRKPLPGNEIAELVYARLLGRQQRVVLLALTVTIVTFVAIVVALPPRNQPTASMSANLQPASSICTLSPACPEWEHAGYILGPETKAGEQSRLTPTPTSDPLQPSNRFR